MLFGLLLLLFVTIAKGDVYLHNPRGSNNRLDEAGRERANANRMFDSQNNNRGGYNVGSLYYLTSSTLSIEWTNQHSCNEKNNHCELVVQYMCDAQLRDGARTTTIPDKRVKCENLDCNTDLEYGMHENFEYYTHCKYRKRNVGLFTADQKLKKATAISTRQNPGGTRRGYECPEERDYYPYWGPSPWKDIVIMTNDVSQCKRYQEESANVKSKFTCIPPKGYLDALITNKVRSKDKYVGITKEDCERLEYPAGSGKNATWTEVPAWNITAPDCKLAPRSRDNHNGNGQGGFPNTYNWTVPNDISENCALRLRYNISTGDYPATQDATNNKNSAEETDIGALVGLPTDEAKGRGYVFKNNPVVQPLKLTVGNKDVGSRLKLRLAMNTAQFGRTFQDRSHRFAIRERPADLVESLVYNLNVRGKRGNIVQVYPAVEYDFIPNRLTLSTQDAVHVQWTGSNSNPNNNDGQGRRGSDRSNIVLLHAQNYAEGAPGDAVAEGLKKGHWGNNYPMRLDVQGKNFLGFGLQDLKNLAVLTPGQLGGELSELDDAGTYFDLGPRKVTSAGTYHYMCTRNNNFSNRSQKGKIVVKNVPTVSAQIGANGGSLTFGDKEQGLWVPAGKLTRNVDFNLETWPSEAGHQAVKANGGFVNVGEEDSSHFLKVSPFGELASGALVTLKLRVTQEDTTLYRSADYKNWQKVENVDISGKLAVFKSVKGGVFVARHSDNTTTNTVVGVVVALVIVAALVIGIVVYMKRRPEALQGLRNINLGLRSKV